MTDPIKVTLPPWRRGDGRSFVCGGEYRVRDPASYNRKGHWPMQVQIGDVMHSHLEWSGPIEFIETDPEPEPLTLPGCQPPIVYRSGAGFACAAYDNNSHARAFFVGKTRREAIVAYNAAVKAMREGEK